jgi:hypothetical protein
MDRLMADSVLVSVLGELLVLATGTVLIWMAPLMLAETVRPSGEMFVISFTSLDQLSK